MSELTKLIKMRGTVKAGLTNFTKFLDEIAAKKELKSVDIIKLKERCIHAENFLIDFKSYHNEIVVLQADDQAEEQLIEQQSFENCYFDALARAKDLIQQYETPQETEAQSVHSQPSVNSSNVSYYQQTEGIKLPDISLPKFSGKFEDWLEFRDTYKSLIHDNNRLSNMQKFHYLRGALEGTAFASISKIKYSADNYEVAWAMITSRFNNKKKLIYEHIKAIYSLENIQKPTAEKIQNLTDEIHKHLGSIEQLGQDISNWDSLLIFWLANKLDSTSTFEWERQTSRQDELPTLIEFLEFLQRRANFVDTLESKNNFNLNKTDNRNISVLNKQKSSYVRSLVTSNSNLNTSQGCIYCKKEHTIYVCPEFLHLTLAHKKDFVRKSNLCYNCLRPGHSTNRCRLGPCKECKRWHNTILHDRDDKKSSSSNVADSTESKTETVSLSSSVGTPVAGQVILSTAYILIADELNNFHKVRALLDCGSQTSFITSRLQERLGINTQNTELSIFGITNNLSKVNKKCKVSIRSIYGNFENDCNCYVLNQITGAIPGYRIDVRSWDIPKNITLADPNFNIPGPIDILLGADIFWSTLGTNKISLGKKLPVLYETSLGWVVSGPFGANEAIQNSFCNLSVNQELLDSLSKFWEIEEISDCKKLSETEQFCENNFRATTKRDATGRFIVELPLIQNPSVLGSSRLQAENRFYGLERKFKRDPILCKGYKEFMLEYLDLKHMTVSNEKENDSFEYFLPHHGVLKESSITTKLRVVFDASAPTTSGLSLNNIQAIGPVLQDDLLSIILRFRKHNYVISADIAKMYRQVLITPDQRQLQKVFWRDNPNDDLKIYKLNTVTYGQASASFLAIRCLFNLADEIEQAKPDIADIIKHDFYVDDLLSGASSIEQAQYICQSISETLDSGGFPLRKWRSNNSECLSRIDYHELEYETLSFTDHSKMKTLGLIWSCKNDQLLYSINSNIDRAQITKRTILSAIAKIFDPLGLISPCTILAKILMQQLWADKLSWDAIISGKILETWLKFENEIPLLNDLEVNRQAICKNAVSTQLHGFADTSEKAYGACIYLRSVDSSGEVHVELLCAKSKVAPLKTITIPRLELSAMLLLSRLFQKVEDSMKMQFESSTLWSDSTIALAWIRTSPNLLKTFTSNRVSEIQSLTKNVQWRYISTQDNPADIVSRGLYPKDILVSRLWWHGPSWLINIPSSWPVHICEKTDNLPEMKSNVLINVSSSRFLFPFQRFSNFSRMHRSVAYMFRFKYNSFNKDKRKDGPLQIHELTLALKALIRLSQNDSFYDEIQDIKVGKVENLSSSTLSLTPFLDENNILRVGGRLRHSDITFNKKHPILLHSKHPFTKLLFAQEHKRLFHAGPQLLLSTIREEYWPIAGRNLARMTVKGCFKCFKFTAKTIEPIMSDLPKERVNPSSAFAVVGVDYAGPFQIKERKGRGCQKSKCYIGLFICLATKAVHLELISSLSSEAFIQALRRFVSRRGKPSKILSDNGSNFIGALRELKSFFAQNKNDIIDEAHSQSIEWSFIPPYSPHFGGLWEAAVKSVKHHLRRVLNNVDLLFEEFATILSQIEAILNSRPLCPLSSDPNDLGSLTPAHFLIGKPLVAIPDQDISDININRLSRFQFIQQLTQHFWNRWKTDYLAELQRRTKWKSSRGQLSEGSLVLIKGEHTMPTQWLLGRILKVHEGADGVARVATVKTAGAVVKRGFQKICPLPISA